MAKGKCIVCGQSPTIKETRMCGPCTFGEADAIGEGDCWPDHDVDDDCACPACHKIFGSPQAMQQHHKAKHGGQAT